MSNRLPQTDWSMIYDLSREGESRDRAMETLVRRYWPAIYAYIRRTGRDVHEASDLTQGFIATVILQRGMAEKADRERGRFRSLLLTSLRNYLHERHRHEQRRHPRKSSHRPRKSSPRKTSPRQQDREQSETDDNGARSAPFTGFDIDAAEGGRFESPEAAFSYHWSATLVRSVLERVRSTCIADDLELHWAVFEARVARPLLFGEPAIPLPVLVERLDLQTPAQASNMLVTVKRRFARALREEVRGTVAAESDVESELSALMIDLERAR